jgi:hypothetical protein
MRLKTIQNFINAIEKNGHRLATELTTGHFDVPSFDIFCSVPPPLFTNEDNFELLKNKDVPGCILYTDNSKFLSDFKNYLKNHIVEEIPIVSDYFNNTPLNILIIKVEEENYKLVYEVSSKGNLAFI